MSRDSRKQSPPPLQILPSVGEIIMEWKSLILLLPTHSAVIFFTLWIERKKITRLLRIRLGVKKKFSSWYFEFGCCSPSKKPEDASLLVASLFLSKSQKVKWKRAFLGSFFIQREGNYSQLSHFFLIGCAEDPQMHQSQQRK